MLYSQMNADFEDQIPPASSESVVVGWRLGGNGGVRRRVLRGGGGASIELGRRVRDGGDPGGSGPPASGEIGARSSVLYTAEASEIPARAAHVLVTACADPS